MSVLTFGMPHRESLRCDHPTCLELAVWRTVVKSAGGPDRELFACKEHHSSLMIGQIVVRIESLGTAGERNLKAEADK
jgi:hypothetical protein